MRKRKPVVGERLYSLNIGNSARHAEQKLTPVIVSKVGRKYFYAEKEGYRLETKYHIDSWVEATDFCANSKLYESAEDWNNEKLKSELLQALSDAFGVYYKKEEFTIEQLKSVCEILSIEVKK